MQNNRKTSQRKDWYIDWGEWTQWTSGKLCYETYLLFCGHYTFYWFLQVFFQYIVANNVQVISMFKFSTPGIPRHRRNFEWGGESSFFAFHIPTYLFNISMLWMVYFNQQLMWLKFMRKLKFSSAVQSLVIFFFIQLYFAICFNPFSMRKWINKWYRTPMHWSSIFVTEWICMDAFVILQQMHFRNSLSFDNECIRWHYGTTLKWPNMHTKIRQKKANLCTRLETG